MRQNDKPAWIMLLFFSFLAFLSLGIEELLLRLEPIVFDIPRPVWGLVQYTQHWATASFFVLFCAIILVTIARHCFHYDIFATKRHLSRKQILLLIPLSLLCVAISLFRNGWQLKLFLDYATAKVNFPSFPILAFVSQYLNHIFRCIALLLLIAFAQEAGSRKSGNPRIPWGAFASMLLWGGLQIYSQGISIGMLLLLQVALMSVAYLLTNRDLRVFSPIMLIVYIL